MWAWLIVRIEKVEDESRKDVVPIAKFAFRYRTNGMPIPFSDVNARIREHEFALRGKATKEWPFLAYVYCSPNRDGKGRIATTIYRWKARRAER